MKWVRIGRGRHVLSDDRGDRFASVHKTLVLGQGSTYKVYFRDRKSVYIQGELPKVRREVERLVAGE
jgi:hypothetical protein